MSPTRTKARSLATGPSSPSSNDSAEAVTHWLIEGARSAPESNEVLAQLCNRLHACGIPLWRVAVFVRTLHPHFMGRRFVWRQGSEVEVSAASYSQLETDDYLQSPFVRITSDGQPLRRRLADPACPRDFPILEELATEGVTDYLASPLHFTYGEIHLATWTTRQPGGFTDPQIGAIEALVAPLSRVAEIRALWRTASTLLNTYVGNQTGERILAGRVRLGETEAIHAAVWLSDLRGFTALADRLPPQSLIDLLNRYFECQVPAILKRGGEVLKFMGDGLLAIFPVAQDNSDATNVCENVLSAAREARTRVAGIDTPHELAVSGQRFGLALHIGEVMYGNVGGGNRLDFTCIGPAVNLAARIEKLTSALGRTILCSAQFAQHCGSALAPLGRHSLRGFEAAQEVFGLADERPAVRV
jgi:adenylate cyclase